MIVPARDAEATIGATLEALAAQDVDADYEVIVVDDGSADATARVAGEANGCVRVISQAGAGPGPARNRGVAEASGRLLAFTDADCVPTAGWLRAGAAALGRAELVQGAVRPHPGAAMLPFDRTIWVNGRVSLYETANLLVRRELFDRLGGFDERFRHAGEDVDLCRRAGEVAYCPEAVVRHPATTSLRAVFERGFRHGHGSVQLGGRRDWRHPKALLAGDWALRRFGIEDEPDLRWVARADYAGRVAGSLWAELRRAR